MGRDRILGYAALLLILVSLLPLLAGQSSGPAAESTGALKVEDKAPLFNANDHAGNLWQASKVLKNCRFLVVYFYPAAMTGGCTAQACAYRDASAPLEQEGISVVGISADPVRNLAFFHTEDKLNFPLLSDVNGDIARRFGVPIRQGGSITRTVQSKQVTLERPFTFARWTFIVDHSGKVVYKNTGVSPAKDPQTVIDFLKSNE
ncbi:MAG: peroxiredoxin [Sedimentisphaerales bacterium]|jgi:peroxiredoxin Q/BCP